MVVLREIPLLERQPTTFRAHSVRLYSGKITVDRWRTATQDYRTNPNTLVRGWFDPIKLPSPEDLQYMVGEQIPAHVPYEERQTLLRGVRMAMERLEEHLTKY